MKLLLLSCAVLVIFCAGALCQDRAAELKDIFTACRKENGVNQDEMENLRQGKINVADVRDDMKCTVKCFMVKSGFMNDAGKFDADAFKSGLPKEDKKLLNDVTEKCKSMEGPNACETAFMIAACMVENKFELP